MFFAPSLALADAIWMGAEMAETARGTGLHSPLKEAAGCQPSRKAKREVLKSRRACPIPGQRRDINNRSTYQSMSATEANSSKAAAT